MKSILLYHNIAPTLAPYGSVVSPEAFRGHIRFIKKLGFRFLEPDDFFNGNSGILLTFDDGFKELYEYAFPILQEESVPAIIFVVSGFAGKKNVWDVMPGKSFYHLEWSKIKEMSRYGITIGSHSHLHPDYTRVSSKIVKKDLMYSYNRISAELGENVKYFSYPFGRAKRENWEELRKEGFERAFTSVPVIDDTPFFTGRWGVYTIDNIYTIASKIGKNKGLQELERIKCRTINWFSNGTGIIRRIIGYHEIEYDNSEEVP